MPNSPQSGIEEAKPHGILYSVGPSNRKALPADQQQTNDMPLSRMTPPNPSYDNQTKRGRDKTDVLSNNTQSVHPPTVDAMTAPKRMKFSTVGEEARAAYTLMQLHLADAELAVKNRTIDRRATN